VAAGVTLDAGPAAETIPADGGVNRHGTPPVIVAAHIPNDEAWSAVHEDPGWTRGSSHIPTRSLTVCQARFYSRALVAELE
jgi:RecJ-like exonuclease